MSEKLEIFGEVADVERIVTGEANIGKVATDGLTKSAREPCPELSLTDS